jgi:hypothetical protein
MGLKLNGTRQLLFYVDDVNLLGDKIRELSGSKQRKVSVYIYMSRHQNTGQNRNIKIASRSFENITKLKYLGTIATDHNLIHEEIKIRLKSDNACYHLVQNLLSSCRLSKNIKIKLC